jgi:primosomal protein N'
MNHNIMKCKYCLYEWISRKSNPKSCPSCKRRLDKKPIQLEKRVERLEKLLQMIVDAFIPEGKIGTMEYKIKIPEKKSS